MGRGHFKTPYVDPPDMYKMDVPLGTIFKPESLKVTLKDNVMTIKAKLDQQSEDGQSRLCQKFVKKFTLPPSVDPSEVKSVLTPQGYLKVEAPLPHHTFPLWADPDPLRLRDGDFDRAEEETEIPIYHKDRD